MMKIIALGAEAILQKKDSTLLKKRVRKGYRHKLLDEQLRKGRTRREARILQKVSNIIAVPKVLRTGEDEIEMQYIQGKLLSTHLDNLPSKQQKQIATKIGEAVSKLHAANIIHGDLTTSNMICTFLKKKSTPKKKEIKLFFIDFGLAFHSAKAEDKAVDLHLLKEALNSKHFRHAETLFKEFTKSYSKHYKEGKKVLDRLTKVEQRGRYKQKGML